MYKCKICGKKYTELTALYNHIENKHADMIPQDMSVQQYYYYMKTGKSNGNCVMCKQPTTWNKNTNKYNRFCGNPKCKDEYVKIMKSRMIAKYGKVHLLNDPEKQREMLSKRSISGTYRWSDNKSETTYTGSYELDFLKTLDLFFEWDPEDVLMPSPHTYTYKYEGEDKFYIPDAFIPSLDLEIEIKDGGDNPNNHYKIQAVDKEKERLKDEVLKSQKNFHYVKLTNKNYTNFFDFLKEIKDGFEKYGDDKKIPRIFKIEDIKGNSIKPVNESTEIIEEGFIENILNDKKLSVKKLEDNDFFISLNYDAKKDSPKDLQDLMSRLIKGAKCEDDMIYIKNLVGKSQTYYYNLLKKRPELKDDYEIYYDWINDGMNKEIKKRMKKIKESLETIEEKTYGLKETNEIDNGKIIYESSISLAYINQCLQNDYEKELKKYLNDYKDYYNKMLKEKPHAVNYINEDIKKAIIFIDGLSDKGVQNDLLYFAKNELGDIVNMPKSNKVVIKESSLDINSELITNTVNLSFIIDPNKNRNLFGMNDIKTQIQLENYIIQRDKIGNHCSVKPGITDNTDKKVLEYTLTFDKNIDINTELKSKMNDGIILNSLFNNNDKDYKFIKEACLRLFNMYPKSIELK